MRSLAQLLTLVLACAGAPSKQEYLATFDDLDGAVHDIYYEEPIGAYDGFYWGNFHLHTAAKNNTTIGGVRLKSAPQTAAYLVQGLNGIDSTRMLELYGPNTFDIHSFYFGCSVVERGRQPSKPVGCSITVKGYVGNVGLLAQQNFTFKPRGRAEASMKKATLNKDFGGLRLLLFNTISKAHSAHTAVFLDDVAVTMYG